MEFATKNPAEDGSAPITNALERIYKMNMTGITIIRTGCQAPWKEALRKTAITTLAAALVFIISATAANASSRIRDIVYVEGVGDNMLVGYGLAVGGFQAGGIGVADAVFRQIKKARELR